MTEKTATAHEVLTLIDEYIKELEDNDLETIETLQAELATAENIRFRVASYFAAFGKKTKEEAEAC